MKRLFSAALPALLILLLFSCDNGSDIADIDFPVTLPMTLHVSVSNTSEMTTSVVFDATTNPEIKEYLGNIKGYEITELLFAIENYAAPNEEEIYFNGEIGFSKKTENIASVSCPVSNLPVTNFAGTGDFELSTCSDVLNDISAILTADNAVKVYMTGSFTKAPASFDLKVTVKVKITASPL